MIIEKLPTRYFAGRASVQAGSTTVSAHDAAWVGNVWGDDLFFLPSQPLVPPQRVEMVNENNTLTLALGWPGADAVEEAYEVRYVGIIERSTAQSRRVLEQLGDVKAWADVFVATDTDRLALESAGNPLRAGFRVLVIDEGLIWAKASIAFGDWLPPAEFKGNTGNTGWSPVHSIAIDGPRRVWQLVDWVGGEGAKPEGIDKYVGLLGLVDDIFDGADVRGPAGDLTGVTPFWQGRITVDATASAALAGLGFSDFVEGLVDNEDAATFYASLGQVPLAQIRNDLPPDKAFRRGNSVGTVSQSGGLPTGALIETGTNSSGRYVRLADGTQICWMTSGNHQINGGTAPVCFSDVFNLTFPAVFVAAPSCSAGYIWAAGSLVFGSQMGTPSTTSIGLRLIGSAPGTWAAASVLAIGRWF